MADGVKPLNTIQDVYADKTNTLTACGKSRSYPGWRY